MNKLWTDIAPVDGKFRVVIFIIIIILNVISNNIYRGSESKLSILLHLLLNSCFIALLD